MAEVSFEWNDGPNAASEHHRLYAFSPDGEKIEPRMEDVAYHKNGKWSYSEKRVFVPVGSVIIQQDRNTHGKCERHAWIAAAGRPQIYWNTGLWSSESTWPVLDKKLISYDAWQKMLRSFLHEDVVAQYERNATIEAI